MSPKLRTRQPRRTRRVPATGGPGDSLLEGLFWVRVIAPENSVGLIAGRHLTIQVNDSRVLVLRGVSPLGVLEPKGEKWVRTYGYSSCVFVKYGSDARRRFQVRIVAS